ncbi:MAG: hypothetical protein LBO63_05390 [Oscillospiraceae bacterium]|jgi:hypothetical protein|nr:hypothetical protein [Oscillospiraceae bacterium]
MFVIGVKLGSFALLSAYAAGGYFFPLRRKKVTKKGTTSLKEAIFFYTGTAVVTMWSSAIPRDVSRWSARTPQLRRTQGQSLSRG